MMKTMDFKWAFKDYIQYQQKAQEQWKMKRNKLFCHKEINQETLS